MASLFNSRFSSQTEPNFRGLFRLLEDFNQYSSQSENKTWESPKFFTPKFDLKETEDTYELHGELPGIEKDNVTVEFTDPQTIVVRGKVERVYSTSSTPTSRDSGEGKSSETNVPITKPGAVEAASTHTADDKDAAAESHQATVEGESVEAGESNTSLAEAKTASSGTDVAKRHVDSKLSVPAHKYWVTERSVGQFSRTFHFPTRVEHDTVSAALNNGVLTITVPKAKKSESKRITIN